MLPPETTVVLANSGKPSMEARPCPALSPVGHLNATGRETRLFLRFACPGK